MLFLPLATTWALHVPQLQLSPTHQTSDGVKDMTHEAKVKAKAMTHKAKAKTHKAKAKAKDLTCHAALKPQT